MINEIFNLMQCFYISSYLNANGECILSDVGNVWFNAKKCKTKKDIICKLLESCSRPIAKGEPYRSQKKNTEWRTRLLICLNDYLKTNFSHDDMYLIYDQLGNGVNHKLTLKFINSGFDLTLLKAKYIEERRRKE